VDCAWWCPSTHRQRNGEPSLFRICVCLVLAWDLFASRRTARSTRSSSCCELSRGCAISTSTLRPIGQLIRHPNASIPQLSLINLLFSIRVKPRTAINDSSAVFGRFPDDSRLAACTTHARYFSNTNGVIPSRFQIQIRPWIPATLLREFEFARTIEFRYIFFIFFCIYIFAGEEARLRVFLCFQKNRFFFSSVSLCKPLPDPLFSCIFNKLYIQSLALMFFQDTAIFDTYFCRKYNIDL